MSLEPRWWPYPLWHTEEKSDLAHLIRKETEWIASMPSWPIPESNDLASYLIVLEKHKIKLAEWESRKPKEPK
jgi:hypothetical protein